jgi:two-component system, cell cycle response regulator DivK
MKFQTRPDLMEGWKILVVDDEFDSQLVASTLLQMCGATVLTANDGAEGLAIAKRELPKFIISDLSMPNMSGWQFLYEIQQYPPTADIPVVALTAHAMQGDREMAISKGFHSYLTKPLTPETFVNDFLSVLIDLPEVAAKAR